MASDNPSRLLALPPEIRNDIYGYVFEGSIINYETPPTTRHGFTSPPPLLIVCKQTYEEAINIYWASTSIIIASYAATMKVITTLIPRARLAGIGRVDVDVSAACEASYDSCPGRRGSGDAHNAALSRCITEFGQGGVPELLKGLSVVCRGENCGWPPFRLLDLPAELRLLVYEKAFESYVVDLVLGGPRKVHLQKAAPPALLVTNRQLYSEAVDIFYALATIRCSDASNAWKVPRFVPRCRWSEITCIEVDVTTLCGNDAWKKWAADSDEQFHEFLRAYSVRDFEAKELAKVVRIKCDHVQIVEKKA